MSEAHIRLWDAEMHLLYDSKADPRTPEQFMTDQMLDEANYSKDYEPVSWKTRDSGRLIRSHDGERLIWSSASEFLSKIMVANNAIFDDPGRFGAELPPIEKGMRVSYVGRNGKVFTGTVKDVREEYGSTVITFRDEG